MPVSTDNAASDRAPHPSARKIRPDCLPRMPRRPCAEADIDEFCGHPSLPTLRGSRPVRSTVRRENAWQHHDFHWIQPIRSRSDRRPACARSFAVQKPAARRDPWTSCSGQTSVFRSPVPSRPGVNRVFGSVFRPDNEKARSQSIGLPPRGTR